MSRFDRLLAKARRNPAGLRFEELTALAELAGFRRRRIRGSHQIYSREGIPVLLNLQEVRGMAKPYQVRQLVALIEAYGPTGGVEE